jgi:outer membrane protein OmpA-like peptidoglycan-associated protein
MFKRTRGQAFSSIHLVWLLAGVIWLTAPTAWAEGEGTAGAPFLKIGTSARAEALGGAFTAIVDDVDATYWNPAGLMRLKRSGVGLTHLEWFEDIRYEYISYADKYDYIGAVGVGLGFLYLGDIPKTLESPSGDYDAANSGGTFGASDLLVNLAWAGNLGLQENKLGIGVKIINESIDENQSFSFGVDVGDQLLISKTRWFRNLAEQGSAAYLIPSTLGVSFKNIGTPVKFFNQNDPLPLTATFGLAYQFMEEDLNVALDFDYQTVEGTLLIRTGGEYWIHTGIRGAPDQMLDVAVRGGYRTGYDSSSAPGFSLGAGIRYAVLGLDYVYMPFGDLGVTHRISLKFSWGDILKDKAPPKRKRVVKRQLTASEAALQERAQQMQKSKKFMEGKVVVQKSPEAMRSMTAVEAKKPEDQAVAKETQELGATGGKTLDKTSATDAIIAGSGKPARLDSELIEQIARGRAAGDTRTRSQYVRRSQEDAARQAKREAEQVSQAFDEVEEAAKEDAQQTATKLVTKTTVYFAKNGSKLNSQYLFALDKIASSFDQSPQRTLLVHGYTSSDETNPAALSMERAKAVKEYLVQMKSIPSNKISIKGFGDKDPVASNTDPNTRPRNRRVRVQIVKAGN